MKTRKRRTKGNKCWKL